MSITVMHTNHSTTTHGGDAIACPRCHRQPLFASQIGETLGPRVDAFCGCEDRGGIVDTGVFRYAKTIDDARAAALAAWNEHDHVAFRTIDDRGDVVRVFRVSEVPHV